MNEQPHRARKRFGQNFLHDQAIINRIVTAISPTADDTLVEIGPGLGALTAPLLQAAGKMQAIEIDRDLIARLPEAMAQHGQLTLHEQDALKADLNQLFPGEEKLRVVGNLPYNISTPLLFHLCDQIDRIADMHFMLQKEVVERMAAGPGSKTYGRLSVMLQYHCQVVPLFVVKPGAFNPPPKVDSAIIRLTPHPAAPYEIGNYALFQKLVTQCFSQRRKTLRNAVNGIATLDQVELAGLDPTSRPETLSGADFGKLSTLLSRE